MKDIIKGLAGGKGRIKRSIFKVEFGTLVLNPVASIGKHCHKDGDDFRHCEIYLTMSPYIRINGKQKRIVICRNSWHYAQNISRRQYAKIIFIKLWW